jgi:hypothetical protein
MNKITIFRTVVTFSITALIIATCYLSSPAQDYKRDAKSRLLYSDLVIRGVILGYSASEVPYKEFNPDTIRPERLYPITNLNLQVIEVLKGKWEEETMTVVVPGGYPDDLVEMKRSFVYMEGMSYNYSIGDEVILSLRYLKSMRGGSYITVTDEGRFILKGDKYENQAQKNDLFTLQEIRYLTNRARTEYLYRSADIVAMGIVGKLETERPEKSTEYTTVTLNIKNYWKGMSKSNQITFKMITGGGYSKENSVPIPAINEGEQWIVFLQKNTEGYFPFAGVNGLLKIVDSRIIINNRVDYYLSKNELFIKLREESTK